MTQGIPWEQEAEKELARRVERMGWDGERAQELRRRVEAVARARGSTLVTLADLDEARARSMGVRPPGEGPAVDQSLTWDADALREVEKETIYLRERLRQRAETLAREAGAKDVSLARVTEARRPSVPMRTQSVAFSTEVNARPAWPVSFGHYRLGDPQGSIAICTLASDDMVGAVVERAIPGVAIVGRAFTENFGVEKVVTNIVANARIRTLILCGTESRHQVGQTLLALHTNGRDAQGKVIGSVSPQPVIRSLSDDAVRIYREKMTVIDLRGEGSVDAVAAKVQGASSSQPWSEAWSPTVPTVRIAAQGQSMGMAGRFTPDPAGLFLIGIGPWGDSIELEHYTREGHLDYRISGALADAISRAIVGNNLIGDTGHALYIGRELQKAETALRLGLTYEQDRALDLPQKQRQGL